MKQKIITVRMDDQSIFQIEYLKRYLHARNTTEVLTEAIHTLYNDAKQKESQKNPYELLQELNLIGCFEGEKDLSQNYKKHITKSLQKKHRSLKSKKK